MIRYALTATVAFAIGFLLGIVIADVANQRRIATTEARAGESKEEISERESAPTGPRWDGQYTAVTDDIYDLNFDLAIFRLAAQVDDDLDASNVYEWGRARAIEFRSELAKLDRPLISRKPFVTVMAEVSVTATGAARFAMMRTGKMTGADAIDKTLIWAEEMERRRLSEPVNAD